MKASKKGYPTDLTDEQWAEVAPLVTRPQRTRGRLATVDLRGVVNAILYQTRTGCQWRMIPLDYPNWSTVRYYFDVWQRRGVWPKLNAALVSKARERAGRNAQPSAVIIDSQSVKTTEAGGYRGFDGGKKNQRAQAGGGLRHAR